MASLSEAPKLLSRKSPPLPPAPFFEGGGGEAPKSPFFLCPAPFVQEFMEALDLAEPLRRRETKKPRAPRAPPAQKKSSYYIVLSYLILSYLILYYMI